MQLVQTKDHIMILNEMIHRARIIRLDSEHHTRQIKWDGDSIAHWEGDTLVVETTNFSPMQEEAAISLTSDAQVVERFTRVSDEQIVYEFSVEDPTYYSQPWHGELSFLSTPSKVYEFACHEGNYAMSGILAGARRAEHDQQQ